MKFIRVLPIIFFTVLAHFSFAQANEKWTLENCIDYALKNNISVLQSGYTAQISAKQHLQSKLNLLPNVDLNFNYAFNYGSTLNPVTYSFENGNAQTAQVDLQGNLTLFNGLQQLNAVKKARYDLLASQFDYENARNNVALNVASAYLQILLNREIVQVAEKQKALTSEQKSIVENKIKAGASPETAIYDIDAQLSRDEATLVNDSGTYDISVLSLKQLLQLNDQHPFEVPAVDVNADNMQSIVAISSANIYDYAVTAQPSIKSAEARLKSAETAVKIQQGYITPTLSAFYNLSTGYASNAQTYKIDTLHQQVVYENEPLSNQLKNDFRKVVGLTLDIPLFSKGLRFTNISTSKLQRQITSLDLVNAKLKLRQDIEQAYANAKAAAESYLANKKSAESSQKAYDATELRYKAGMASNFDIQQAKNNLIAAESQMVQAKYTYVFRLKILDFYQDKPITLN